MEPIRSTRNPAVIETGRLHRVRERRQRGRTILEGPNLVGEAMRAGISIERTFALTDDPRAGEWPAVTLVDHPVMRKLAATDTPRGPVAVMQIPDWTMPDATAHLLVLWGVSDPGNVGTIIRSAAAFGLGVVVGPESADVWSPKALRAGAGGHFRLASLSSVDRLKELPDHRLAATVVSGGQDPAQLGSGPWALVIGGEPHGLDADVTATTGTQVTIPMAADTESLNAAVAASILAYILKTGSGRRPAAH
ncbi:MAG TPA: RNA methyltransferase [Acidimicrobiia bacterium]|nr:RNA methyltransferase [Acidimicrobiia bacterium]